jgi:hypothetical protein
MAGLSMGGMQTRVITLANPQVFSFMWVVFSGGSISPDDVETTRPVLKKTSNFSLSVMEAASWKADDLIWVAIHNRTPKN